MRICDSCGGIIGRECFNPKECMENTRQQATWAAEQSRQAEAEHYANEAIDSFAAHAVTKITKDIKTESVDWQRMECSPGYVANAVIRIIEKYLGPPLESPTPAGSPGSGEE